MRVAFWNRRKEAAAGLQAEWLAQGCDRGCPPWDLLILAEVTEGAASRFQAELGPVHTASWTSGSSRCGSRPHGVMILSRTTAVVGLGFPTGPPRTGSALEPVLAAFVEDRLPGASRPRPLPPERWVVAELGTVPTTVVAGFHAPYAAGRHVTCGTRPRTA